MDFAMNVDKLNLANLVEKVTYKIMEYQLFAKVNRKIQARDLQKITEPLLHKKSRNLSQKPHFRAKKAKPL